MTKRLISILLAVIFIVCLIPAGAIAVSAAPTQLDVKWNTGAVGGPTNSNKNKVIENSSGYRYSEVIIIEKAGTKVYFTDSSIAGDSTYYLGHTLLAFSTWKQSGSDWVMDLEGANVSGTFQYGNSIGQTLVDGTVGGGMRYEFITDHDNQAIRLCYRSGTDTTDPIVYAEPTTEKSTLEQLNARDFTATLNADGTVTGLQWFCGYASSATNTNGSAKEVRYASADYANSGLILIPKSGTKISYTIATTPNANYNAFTRYTKDGNRYVYDVGFAATDALVKNGNTYSYVTTNDNEVIRLCVRANLSYSTIAVDAPVKVTWEQTNETGTASNVVNLKTEWPDAELISLVTGAPLIATSEVTGLQWYDGYVGSQYHDSKAYAITSPTNQDYDYSDVFTVPKAGTTVYFFDQTFQDFDGSKYASTSVMTVSHWEKKGSTWVFDKTREYLTGCDVYNILLTDDYRVYAYTTKEDNENIRLCLRYAPMYAGEDEVIPPVYLVEPTDFATITATGALNEASYTDMSGDKVTYNIYLPIGYTADKQYTLVFDNSTDGAVAKSLVAKNYKGMVVSYAGELAKSLRLLDEVCAKYPVKISDLMLVGDDKLAAHAVEFENIRLANTMLVTSGTVPTAEYAQMKALSSFASVDEAAAWLVGESEDYYNVLEGITMYAIGDSYFGGSGLGQHQTWVNLLGYKYGMTFHNYGIGGNTVAAASGQSSNQPPMYTRYNEMPNGGDIYILEGGRNDRHYSVPFGENTDTNGNTFKGAFNVMIKAIRENNPDALIILVTPWSYSTEKGYLGSNNDYADAIQELADYYNDPHIVCLYAADTDFTGIDMAKPACRAKYCLTTSDVSHLNADGMYLVAPIFDKWIAEKYAALKGLTLTNSADEDKFHEIVDINIPDDTTTAENVTTTTPVENTPTTTTEPVENNGGGCGGFVALGLVACIIPLAAVGFKKKD